MLNRTFLDKGLRGEASRSTTGDESARLKTMCMNGRINRTKTREMPKLPYAFSGVRRSIYLLYALVLSPAIRYADASFMATKGNVGLASSEIRSSDTPDRCQEPLHLRLLQTALLFHFEPSTL